MRLWIATRPSSSMCLGFWVSHCSPFKVVPLGLDLVHLCA